jgi:hypothetical protein
MDEKLDRALMLNIKGALGLSRDLTGHEARRILRVIIYTLKREGFSISRTGAPHTQIELKASHVGTAQFI